MSAINLLLRPDVLSASKLGGHAFVIRAIPDLFTGEMFNIGVCIVPPIGPRLVRVIQSPGRLECLYGDAAQEIVVLAKHAAYCALHDLAAPARNVIFEPREPYYNLTPEHALKSFFENWVTVALAKVDGENLISSFTTEDARREVLNVIKRLRPISAITRLVPESPNMLINVGDKTRLVNVPLQPNFGAGTIESADYGAETIRFHLLDRITDLAAVHSAGKAAHLAMFIIRPQRTVSETKLRQIDSAIDKVVWKAPKGMRIEVESSIDRAAQLAIHWADEVSNLNR